VSQLSLPAPVTSLRLDGIRAFRVVDDEDGLVLVVSDGETTIEFACGLAGPTGASALGARRLADATLAYARVAFPNSGGS
jgi:hypothetical protein